MFYLLNRVDESNLMKLMDAENKNTVIINWDSLRTVLHRDNFFFPV